MTPAFLLICAAVAAGAVAVLLGSLRRRQLIAQLPTMSDAEFLIACTQRAALPDERWLAERRRMAATLRLSVEVLTPQTNLDHLGRRFAFLWVVLADVDQVIDDCMPADQLLPRERLTVEEIILVSVRSEPGCTA